MVVMYRSVASLNNILRIISVASINSILRAIYRKKYRAVRISFVVLGLTLTILIDSMVGIGYTIKQPKQRKLCEKEMIRHPNARKRRLFQYDCATYWPQGTGALVPWEINFPPIIHTVNEKTIWPTSNVAYITYFEGCPDNVDYTRNKNRNIDHPRIN